MHFDQAKLYQELHKAPVLENAFVHNLKLENVLLERRTGESVEIGKGVTFVNCDLTTFAIKGGDASLLTFDHCAFDASFLNERFKPALGYGIEFVCEPGSDQVQHIRDYWRSGHMTDYSEVEVLLVERNNPKKQRVAIVCKGTLIPKVEG